LHRRDIGTERLSWHELGVLTRHSGPDTSFYRHVNKKSWDWNANTEFLSAILYVLQWANWQRAGGEGEKPQLIKRPGATVMRDTRPIEERRRAQQDELARRRVHRSNAPGRNTIQMKEVDVG
jgi:hypothetical protein